MATSTDLYAVAGECHRAITMGSPEERAQFMFALDFCLVPMGTAEPSVSIRISGHYINSTLRTQVAEYIAECVRVLEKTGLKFKVSI